MISLKINTQPELSSLYLEEHINLTFQLLKEVEEVNL